MKKNITKLHFQDSSTLGSTDRGKEQQSAHNIMEVKWWLS